MTTVDFLGPGGIQNVFFFFHKMISKKKFCESKSFDVSFFNVFLAFSFQNLTCFVFLTIVITIVIIIAIVNISKKKKHNSN